MRMMTEPTTRPLRRVLHGSVTIVQRDDDWLAYLTCNAEVQVSASTAGGAIALMIKEHWAAVHDAMRKAKQKAAQEKQLTQGVH